MDGSPIEMEQPERVVRVALVPHDVLVDILTRLAPRGLAAARGVCRAWRAVVDGSRLLRADLLPLSVSGIFINFNGHRFSEYFSRPSTSPTISGMIDYLPSIQTRILIEGHCNGLLLLDGDYVVNPATQWWAFVPPSSHTESEIFYYRNYLVFDPTLSSHYEVFSIPHFYDDDDDDTLHHVIEDFEWPLSSCIFHVFSSKKSHWEERSFIRDGEAVGKFSEMRTDSVKDCAVYYREVLYVHCQKDFVMRISLTNNRYQAIKPPTEINPLFHLGKSKDGVYFASLGPEKHQIRVWVLNNRCGQPEWFLKYDANLSYVLHENFYTLASGPWVLQNVNYNFYSDRFPNDKKEAQLEEKYEWDSDNDNVLNGENRGEKHYCGTISLLGFHPFKEVIFVCLPFKRGLAYHLNTSKVQDLGNLHPTKYEYEVCQAITNYFPYTPCWT
ncbi:hypothetical protein BAE44_0004117 [Dichanthelium oligosanthes]|uniref:F-box domain-containing protein n=1 Tax=Dichanthelium oligosanthes TaxID=888268 RepID=A0A1E5WC15_9POAL|nr:hypothetical protein BAE44_0004117 [Dichanthelium oligosanthes]